MAGEGTFSMRFACFHDRQGVGGIAAILGVALLLPACASTDPNATASASAQPSMTSRLTGWFSSSAPAGTTTRVAATNSEDIDCPSVEIRTGAGTLVIASRVNQPTANDLRYQLSFNRFARECHVVGGTLSVKVGVEGRIILGPAGGPGTISVPVRYAVVREGPEPRTITTRFHRFPVSVGPGQTNVDFTHIEDSLTFPMPSGNELAAYVIYVGFDEQGRTEPVRAAKKKKPAPKRVVPTPLPGQ
jgi:hypothetical protein